LLSIVSEGTMHFFMYPAEYLFSVFVASHTLAASPEQLAKGRYTSSRLLSGTRTTTILVSMAVTYK
jgi:hypothetical protein